MEKWRSRSALFLASSLFLVLLAAWAFAQQSTRRSPWLKYQREALEFETRYIERQLKASQEDSPAGASISVDSTVGLGEQELRAMQARIDAGKTRAILDGIYYDLRLERRLLKEATSRGDGEATLGQHQKLLHEKQAEAARLEQLLAQREANAAQLDVVAKSWRTSFRRQASNASPVTQELRTRLALLRASSPSLRQIRNPRSGIQDRCVSCHVNSDKCGLSRPSEIVSAIASGMTKEEAAKRFCVTSQEISAALETHAAICRTQDSITENEQVDVDGNQKPCAVDDMSKKLEQVIEAYCGNAALVAVCKNDEQVRSFQEALKTASFDIPAWARTHPERDRLLSPNHPIESIGCTACHSGDGMQTYRLGDARRDGIASEHPTEALAGPLVEASCGGCHLGKTELEGAPLLSQGRRLFTELGCSGCHTLQGFDDTMIPGPQLRRVADKLTPSYLVEWIRQPYRLQPRTRMPIVWARAVDETGFERSGSPEALERANEVLPLAAYLLSVSENTTPADAAPGDIERGKILFDRIGCRGCHSTEVADKSRPTSGSRARDFAPNLSAVGSRVLRPWLLGWLIDPSAYWNEARMPGMRLSEAEAADLADYLMELREESDPAAKSVDRFDEEFIKSHAAVGRTLVRKWGCFNCHEIPGFERMHRMGADLEGFGVKRPSDLDFGDAITNPEEQTWKNWVELKLKQPHAFVYERAGARMPQFFLSDEERKALFVFLRSLAPPRVDMAAQVSGARADGQLLVADYGCRNCHVIDGRGGLITDRYCDDIEDRGFPEDEFDGAKFIPPDLVREGTRTRPSWLYGYMRSPTTIRPWMLARMPSFKLDGDVATVSSLARQTRRDGFEGLAELFSSTDATSYPFVGSEPIASKDDESNGELLVKAMNCQDCHVLPHGRPRVGVPVAPDLSAGADRFRPGWISYWLRHTRDLLPGTAMPNFFVQTDSGRCVSAVSTLLEGDCEGQLKALEVYVFLLSSKCSSGDPAK